MNQVNITKINADKIKQIGNQYSISKANPYSGLKIYNNVTSRIILSQKDSQLKHIFRETNGHLTDTIEIGRASCRERVSAVV